MRVGLAVLLISVFLAACSTTPETNTTTDRQIEAPAGGTQSDAITALTVAELPTLPAGGEVINASSQGPVLERLFFAQYRVPADDIDAWLAASERLAAPIPLEQVPPIPDAPEWFTPQPGILYDIPADASGKRAGTLIVDGDTVWLTITLGD